MVIPALTVGLAVSVLGGTEDLGAGLVVGGLFGAILARLRRGFHAVRTEDGIERRLRPERRSDREDGSWTRLANVEYHPEYDRLLATVLLAVGVAAFGAIPFVEPGDGLGTLWLVLLGLFGLTTALMTYGVTLLK